MRTPKRLDPQSPSSTEGVKRARIEQRPTPTSVHQGQSQPTQSQMSHQSQQVSQQSQPSQQAQPIQQNLQRQPISQAHNYNRQNSQTMVTRSEAFEFQYQIR